MPKERMDDLTSTKGAEALAQPQRGATEFTPGPWHISNRNYLYGGAGIDVHDTAGNKWVASVNADHDTPEHFPTNDQCEANARLIAAAPDLLEALEGVLRVADRDTMEFDAARAAIRKAKGE